MSYTCKCQCASFREHALGVSISAQAVPTRTRSKEAIEVDARESRWDRDHPAYRRLVKQGYQPPSPDGCAELEARATHPIEIERGQIFGKETAQKMAEVTQAIGGD